jgi:hypothetical protein
MASFLHASQTNLLLCAAVLTEHFVYVKRHFSVRPVMHRIDQSDPHWSFRQAAVSFELATLLQRTLQVPVICNKTYGNLLSVATGWSSCEICTAVLVEQICTGLMDFVGWSWVFNFAEAHGGFIN